VSSDALDATIDLDRVVDLGYVGDVGLPHGAALLAFVNAVHLGEPALDDARRNLVEAVGDDGLTEAAATIAVFNGLVRVADGTGIQLDAGLDEFSRDDRTRLGIDRFAGAANTASAAPGGAPPVTIGDLFG